MTTRGECIEVLAPSSYGTLRNFIKAMGGNLEIIATFPDGSVHISQFEVSEVARVDYLTIREERTVSQSQMASNILSGKR